jgi:hypothetical protein
VWARLHHKIAKTKNQTKQNKNKNKNKNPTLVVMTNEKKKRRPMRLKVHTAYLLQLCKSSNCLPTKPELGYVCI